MKIKVSITIIFIFIFNCFLPFLQHLEASQGDSDYIATISYIFGKSTLKRNGVEIPIQLNTRINNQDSIITSKDSELGIRLMDGSVMKLHENTCVSGFKFESTKDIMKGKVEISLGTILANINKFKSTESNFEVVSPSASVNASNQGAVFTCEVNKEGLTKVSVIEGNVRVRNMFYPDDGITIKAGESAMIKKGQKSISSTALSKKEKREINRWRNRYRTQFRDENADGVNDRFIDENGDGIQDGRCIRQGKGAGQGNQNGCKGRHNPQERDSMRDKKGKGSNGRN